MKASRRAMAMRILLLCAAFAAPAAAQPIRIAGSGANVGAIELLAAAYAKSNPGAVFSPIEVLGSGGAARAAAAGALHLALLSRPLSDSERAAGLTGVEYARTPFVLVVTPQTGLRNISHAELAALFEGRLAQWPGGARARVALRPAEDVDTHILKSLSPKVSAALDVAYRRPGMIVAVTDREAADIAERTPGTLAASTLGLILAERRALLALRIEGAEPTVKALQAGRYPVHKRLFVVFGSKPLPEPAKRFVDYLQGAEAKALLERTGHAVPPFRGG